MLRNNWFETAFGTATVTLRSTPWCRSGARTARADPQRRRRPGPSTCSIAHVRATLTPAACARSEHQAQQQQSSVDGVSARATPQGLAIITHRSSGAGAAPSWRGPGSRRSKSYSPAQNDDNFLGEHSFRDTFLTFARRERIRVKLSFNPTPGAGGTAITSDLVNNLSRLRVRLYAYKDWPVMN